MEQIYTSTALILGLGYDPIQKFTQGRDQKVCEFFQVLDFRRHLRCSYKKSKTMNLFFRHISFTEVVSSQWVLIKTKILQNFATVSGLPSKAVHEVVFGVTQETGKQRKESKGSNKVTALIHKFTVSLICDTKGMGLEQLLHSLEEYDGWSNGKE